MSTKTTRARKPAAPVSVQLPMAMSPSGDPAAPSSVTALALQRTENALTQPAGTFVHLAHAVGTRSPELATALLNQAYRTLPGSAAKGAEELLKTTVPALAAIAPRDELEGMMAVQLTALHNLAMHHLSWAALPDQPLVVSNAGVNNATKILRAFSQQLETLNRYRGKGQQKVTVEHVHVHSGGQAVVGAIEAPRGRGDRG